MATWGKFIEHAKACGAELIGPVAETLGEETRVIAWLERHENGVPLICVLPRDCAMDQELPYTRMLHNCKRLKIKSCRPWPIDL